MSLFAVIGNPIAHSLSPIIHQAFAKQLNVHLSYQKIKSDEQSFTQQVNDFFAEGGKGVNVTLPFKERAYALAAHSTARCQAAKAANTLWVQGNELWADNTDGVGLIRDLQRYIQLPGKRILILGAGGAVRGIINPLLSFQPNSLVIANRTLSKAQELCRDFPGIECTDLSAVTGQYDLVINATSASLSGKFIDLPKELLLNKPFCYDLAYQQKGPTVFVDYARALGCEAQDGLGMLVEQAAEAFCIWHGMQPETELVLNELRVPI